MHGFAHGYCHRTFLNTWDTNDNRNLNYALRNETDLIIPAPHFEGFKRYPIYDFAKAWNNLGPMKYQPNESIFKTWLKNEIFTQMVG